MNTIDYTTGENINGLIIPSTFLTIPSN